MVPVFSKMISTILTCMDDIATDAARHINGYTGNKNLSSWQQQNKETKSTVGRVQYKKFLCQKINSE